MPGCLKRPLATIALLIRNSRGINRGGWASGYGSGFCFAVILAFPHIGILYAIPVLAWSTLATAMIGLAWLVASPFQRVRRAAGFEPGSVPSDLTGLLRGWIKESGTAPLIKIARASGKNRSRTFADGLPAVKELIFSYGMHVLVDVAKENGESSLYVLRDGLPMVKDQITSQSDLTAYGIAFGRVAG
jgi:hypothetical protein